ncbi:MAG: Swt1 family HEPN domain-containing protein, partial [Acidimicrobiales bacterium]
MSVATSNRERVGRAFESLAEGLGPFVERQMRSVHGEGWLETFVDSGPRSGAPASLRDPAFLLKVTAETWDSAFRSRLTRTDRNLVFELRDVRNRWAHNDAFNADDT